MPRSMSSHRSWPPVTSGGWREPLRFDVWGEYPIAPNSCPAPSSQARLLFLASLAFGAGTGERPVGEFDSRRTVAMAKILVVEERKSLRTLYKLDLESEGYAVVTARSADEALRTIGSESLDLVVCEIGPPGMDGLQAMERMIARLPETPVVLNSASSPDRIPLPSPGPDACIVKSSDTGELRAKIRELLDFPMMLGERRIRRVERRSSRDGTEGTDPQMP